MSRIEKSLSSVSFENMLVNYFLVSDLQHHYVIKDIIQFKSYNFNENSVVVLDRKHILVKECTFKRDFFFSNVNSLYNIEFSNCIFEGDIYISNCNLVSLLFENTKCSNINIHDSVISIFSYNETECNRMLLSSNKKNFIDLVAFINSKVDYLGLSGSHYGDLFLNNVEINNFYKREDYSNTEIDVDEPLNPEQRKVFYETIKIELGKNSKGINLNRVNAKNIGISGVLRKEYSIFFKDIKVEEFELNDFINEGKIRLHNVKMKPNGTGKITDSQLGKMEFNSVDFSKASNFQIYLSNLTEIITTNTVFPKTITGRTNTDYFEVREVYRQLKFAASKQGDRIKELEYEQYEMINYENALTGLRNWKDKIILWSNRITNNHGQDYTITLFWFLPLTVFLFILIKINLGYSFEWGVLRANDISQYVESSLNPLHDFSKVFNEPISDSVGKARLFDSILKLVSGYLIFQFLRAFRKYVK